MPAPLWKINSRKYFREFLSFSVMFRYNFFGVTFLSFLVVGKNTASNMSKYMSSLTRIFPHKNWNFPCRRFCPHTGKKGQENPYSSMFYAVLQREKCPYPEFFWSVFSRIWTEYEEIIRISSYSVWLRENTYSFHTLFTFPSWN